MNTQPILKYFRIKIEIIRIINKNQKSLKLIKVHFSLKFEIITGQLINIEGVSRTFQMLLWFSSIASHSFLITLVAETFLRLEHLVSGFMSK